MLVDSCVGEDACSELVILFMGRQYAVCSKPCLSIAAGSNKSNIDSLKALKAADVHFP